MNRQCTRSDCGEAAVASLSFDYQHRTAWLADGATPHPAAYGLCRRHADGLSVPRGWALQDQRADAGPVTPGAPAARVDRAQAS